MSQSGERLGAHLPLLMVPQLHKAPKYLPGCPRRGLSHHRGCQQVPSEPASTVPSLQSSVACSNSSRLSCFPTNHPASAYPKSPLGAVPVPLGAVPVPLGAAGGDPAARERERERDAGRWMLDLVALGVLKLLRGVPNNSEHPGKGRFWGASPRLVQGKGSCPSSWHRGPTPGSDSLSVLASLATQPMPSTF